MATITYTLVDYCGGGGHTQLDVSLNAGEAKRTTVHTDEIRAPLSEMTPVEQRDYALMTLRVHMAGKTRQQIGAEFDQGPVTVTI